MTLLVTFLIADKLEVLNHGKVAHSILAWGLPIAVNTGISQERLLSASHLKVTAY